MRNAHVFLWKISHCLGYVKVLLKVRTVFLFSVEAILWKIITVFERKRISWNVFVRKAHVLLWNEKCLFGICQSIVKSGNSFPILCRCFTLKDNHAHLKVYELNEMLFWETHMCFNEMRSHCMWYVTELWEWELCSLSL